MNIDPALYTAVQSRIASGLAKETIVAELEAAGYDQAAAQATYDAVMAEGQGADDVSPVPSAPAAASDASTDTQSAPAATATAPASTPDSPSTSSFLSQHAVALLVGIGAVVLLGGGVALAALSDVSDWRSWIPFVDQAPYNEVTLLPGIITHLAEQSRVDTTGEFLLAIEPRTPGTPEGFEDELAGLTMLAALAGMPLPDEASMRLTAQSSYDESNPDELLATVQGEVEVDFDIMNIEMSGSLRAIGDTVYGRIDQLPASVRQEFDQVPVGRWIQLPVTADIEELYGNPFLNTLPGDWSTVPEAFALTPNRVALGGQMASIASTFTDSLAADAEYDEVERAALVQAIADAWIAAPLTVLTSKPNRTEVRGEVVYEYDVAFTRERTMAFIEALRTELQAFPELITALPDSAALSMILPNKEGFDFFNEAVDVLIGVRADGSLYSLHIEAVVTSPDQSFPAQLRYRVYSEYTYPSEPLVVSVPDDVYEQTLLELMAEQQQAAQSEAQSAFIMQQVSMFRSQAEIYYNQNNFSYLGACDEYMSPTGGGGYGLGPAFECVDSATDYLAQYPLPETPVAYCVDSTGYADTIMYQPLTTNAARSTCELE